jgi:WD40 repeat protein
MRVAFSNDGKQIAGISQAEGGGIAVWATESGALTKTLDVPNSRLAAIAFAPDGRTLVSGTEHGQIQLWNLGTGKAVQTFEDKSREKPLSFLFLEFSPRGDCVAIGDVYNADLLLWSPATGKVLREIKGIAGPRCAAFSADGRALVTGDSGHIVRLWDVESAQENLPFRKPEVAISPIALSADGRTLATYGQRQIQLWEFPAARMTQTIGRRADHFCAAFAPQGGLLATGSADGYIRFFDRSSDREIRKFLAHHSVRNGEIEPEPVAALAFSPDGKLLASGGFDSMVRVWDVETGKQRHAWSDRKGWVFCVAFSPDGKTVAGGGCTSDSMSTCLWDVNSGKLKRRLEGSPAMVLKFSKKGDELVTAGGLFGGWYVTFVNAQTGEELACTTIPEKGILDEFFAAALSPDGRTLALGSMRGIGLWDMASRNEVRRIQGEFGSCSGLAFAPDGTTLIAAHGDGTVLFWDVSDRVMQKGQ